MIDVYALDPDDPGNNPIRWTGENKESPARIFLYSNFVEMIFGEWEHEHIVVPFTRIDHISWLDADIANGRVKIMEPVRHKQ